MRTRRLTMMLAGLAAGLLAWWTTANAWHDDGHDRISHAAVDLLPDDVPAWFRAGGDAIAHQSIDPDVFRHNRAPQLTNAEAPEHYLDWELLKGAPLPTTRYDFIALCAEKKLNPRYVGALPYAITEWAQRLTLAFTEHRKWPDNAHIKSKCLIYAGMLAHYSEDACMPLHTTVHFNGRVGADGKSPKTGIHAIIDALPGKLLEIPADRLNQLKPVKPFEDLWAGVLKELTASHALVDRAYELENQYPDLPTLKIEDAAVREFTLDRTLASANFTARLLLTAWRHSADIKLHHWLERPPQFPNETTK